MADTGLFLLPEVDSTSVQDLNAGAVPKWVPPTVPYPSDSLQARREQATREPVVRILLRRAFTYSISLSQIIHTVGTSGNASVINVVGNYITHVKHTCVARARLMVASFEEHLYSGVVMSAISYSTSSAMPKAQESLRSAGVGGDLTGQRRRSEL
ncbi:hypothetical protein HWV62_43866 [Athelia sp. TMB]|nr:hypothetical protein HWV62_43866 [Athelia sp. TMB]